jgi:HD superfamily phosphohydrolase
MLARVAALLHDVGHYPFSHALEEIGALNHEEVARPLICGGEVATSCDASSAPMPRTRSCRSFAGERSPLQGLISGSIDLDKLDYLRRDAFMCGVSYGEIDVDRLINALTLVRDPDTGRPAVGMIEKGLSALESLLFAQYQMYRNVYWHHAVRSATAMYKRLVADALTPARSTRERSQLHRRRHSARPAHRVPSQLVHSLRERRLYKRAFECPRRTSRPTPASGSPTITSSPLRWRTPSPTSSPRSGRVATRLPDQNADARTRSARTAFVR